MECSGRQYELMKGLVRCKDLRNTRTMATEKFLQRKDFCDKRDRVADEVGRQRNRADEQSKLTISLNRSMK